MTFDRAWILAVAWLPLAWMVFEWRRTVRHAALVVKALSLAAILLALAEPRLNVAETRVALAVLVGLLLFGLLAALAIALYALRVPARGYLDREVSRTSLPTQAFPTLDEGFTPTTDDLPVLPTQFPVTSEQGQVTDALPRRVLLLPSHTDTRTPVTAGAGVGTRSTGLLSRYRESQQ